MMITKDQLPLSSGFKTIFEYHIDVGIPTQSMGTRAKANTDSSTEHSKAQVSQVFRYRATHPHTIHLSLFPLS